MHVDEDPITRVEISIPFNRNTAGLIEDELKKFETELKETNRNYIAILNKMPLAETDREYDEIINLCLVIRKKLELILEIEEAKEEDILKIPELKTLRNNDAIKNVFKQSIEQLLKIKSYEYDEEGLEEYLLYKMIQRGVDYSLYNNLNSLKYGLKKILEKEMHNMLNSGKKFREIKVDDIDKIKINKSGKKFIER